MESPGRLLGLPVNLLGTSPGATLALALQVTGLMAFRLWEDLEQCLPCSYGRPTPVAGASTSQ